MPRKSRLSGPQLQAQLSRLTDQTRFRRLKERLLSKGAWQQVTRMENLCHAQVSHKLLFHLDASAGSVLTPHDNITNVQKTLGNRLLEGDSVGAAAPSSTLSWSIQKPAAPLVHYACVHAVVCGMKFSDPGITTEPRGLTASQSRPADVFTTAAVPGRSAALDVCVASSIAAAARGDAAQAAFDRIGSAATSCRDSNDSVRSRHRLQSHRATSVGEVPSSQMEARNPNRPPADAVLSNASVLAEWLFAGIDRALHHWGHVPALDGGLGCTTLTSTVPTWNTALPDDDDDVVSFESFSQESVEPSCLRWVRVFVVHRARHRPFFFWE